MKIIFEIARTELKKLFFSPVAWLILVIFTLQIALQFVEYFTNFTKGQALGMTFPGVSSITYAGLLGIYSRVLGYLFLYIPLITMGIMSREFSIGSIKLLYSSPITNTQIILGKFLSLVMFALTMIGALGIFSLCGIFTIDHADVPFILCGLIGVFLLICTYSAIGLFLSTLTSYMVVAAMGTLGILSLLSYVKGLWQDMAFVRDITWWISPDGRAINFVDGLITSEDFLYFILVTGMFLVLTIVRLNNVRQKNRGWLSISRYLVVIIITCVLGFVSTQPRFKVYADLTWTKSHTLTKGSQEIVKKLPDNGVTITTYVNMLEANYNFATPQSYKLDVARFENYTRFSPGIKMKYVYYYQQVPNPALDLRYPKLNARERIDSLRLIYEWNFDIVPYSKIRDQIDLSGENYRLVRVISTPDGKKSFLRIFKDAAILPFESEISAAFNRLVSPTPTIGFLTGHGENAITDTTDRGYSTFTQEKSFRYSLINQGFDFSQVSLADSIPGNLQVLIIAGMRIALTEKELNNLQEYINRGGNLMILARPGSQEYMNPIVEKFGVSLLPGTLVHPMNNTAQNFILPSITAAGKKLSYYIDYIPKVQMEITLPRTGALAISNHTGFKAIPILTTKEDNGWTELETKDFVNDTARFNPAAGELRGQFPLAVAVSRKVGNKDQKIIVTADADFLSNGELGTGRKSITSGNFNYLYGMIAYMNDYKLPIDMRRESARDIRINISAAQWAVLSILLKWILPLALSITGALIWFRRKRK